MPELDDDDALLAALGMEVTPLRESRYTAEEERLIAGFEEIQRWATANGRAPQHGESNDVFERLYAVRLDRLRRLRQGRALLAGRDTTGLLEVQGTSASLEPETLDDDSLLAELGLAGGGAAADDITILRHVRSFEERRAAEEIANRKKCEDFDKFELLFETVRAQLASGERQTRAFHTRSMDEIQQGTFFIVGGQIAFVAEVGEAFTTEYERRDSRLRVIYDNGTESEVLQRSLQRALHRDEVARLITDPNAGPLFGDAMEADDIESGTIYVLRSLSSQPFVAQHRELIHKIGVTGGKVETRTANAEHDATYLLAKVEVVATYKLSHIHRTRLENLFHRIFAGAQIDLTIEDRFGHPVKPREWFLVPLQAIDEAVNRIRDGSITEFTYDVASARLVKGRSRQG